MTAAETTKRTGMLRVTLASLFGTTLEFYDHFLYGSAAAIIFPAVFFVNMSPMVALLLSLVTYSVAFLARPLGAVIFGHFGDRIGRKNVLIVALLIMGCSTFCIGCLPSYEAGGSFGAVALCFLRLFQGIALGGEWGGAALIVSEYAGKSKLKSFFGSIVQLAAPIGFLLASGLFAIISDIGSNEFLMTWGWRIPFWLSALLVLVGLYMRSSIQESPEFLAVAAEEQAKSEKPAPLLEVLRHHLKPVLLAIGTRIGSDAAFYVFALFPMVYLPMIGVTADVAFLVGVFSSLGQIVGTPLFGKLCDHWGTRRVLILGAVVNIGFGFAYFAFLNTGSTPIIMLGAFLSLFCLSILWAPLASHLPAMFPVEVRYTATSIGFQAAGIFGGALAPTICLLLLENTGSGLSVAVYLAAVLLLALFCTVKTKTGRE